MLVSLCSFTFVLLSWTCLLDQTTLSDPSCVDSLVWDTRLIVWRSSLQQVLMHTWVYFSPVGSRKPVSCCFWTLTFDDTMLFLCWWFSCLHSPDMTPCMSPLPHDSPLIEKPGLGQIQEESEGAGFKALSGKGLSICKVFASSPSISHPVLTHTPLPTNLTLVCRWVCCSTSFSKVSSPWHGTDSSYSLA